VDVQLSRPPTIDDVIPGQAELSERAAAGLGLAEWLLSCKAVQRTLRRGEFLFRGGEPFDCVFLVRDGCIKKCVSNAAGERVWGFRVAGELLGLDSMRHVCHVCDAKALCRSTVWAIPYVALLAACSRCSRLRERLTLAQVAEIRRQRSIEQIGHSCGAAQRVSAFVRDVTLRSPLRGRDFLRRNRDDVARFLAVSAREIARELRTPTAQAFVPAVGRDERGG